MLATARPLLERALHIDETTYGPDQHGAGDSVASQLARQLAEPAPKDRSTTRNLRQYKNLAARWREWDEVVAVCRKLATTMVEGLG